MKGTIYTNCLTMHFDPMDNRFYDESWMPRKDGILWLQNIMDADPERFASCKIVKDDNA